MNYRFSLLSRLKNRTGRPPLAVEIAPGGVAAAAKHGAEPEIKYAFHALPEGSVVASATQPNLRSTDAIVAAIRSTLEAVSGAKASVTVLLPDPSARVFTLEFDSLPTDHRDILAVLRLRLKKVVPFEVDTARISYQLLRKGIGSNRVLAVIVSGTILGEYEAAVREAGFEPGAVLPSGLSALAALKSDEPMLSAYLSGLSLTTSITTRNNVFLYRTHELPSDSLDRKEEVERDIAVAVAYFEDELKSRPQCLHYAGSFTTAEFARAFQVQHLPVIDFTLVPQNREPTLPNRSNAAGLVGALAGARSD